MKKWSILLLICCLLAGCTAAPAAREPAESTPSPAAEPAPEEACICTVEMMDWEDSAVDGDGTSLATCRVHMPVLTARRADGTAIETAGTEAEARALTAAETFNAQFAAWTLDEEFQELADLAREERAWRQESGIDWGPAFFTEMTSETYQTDRLVSVAGDYYSYTGGAHPNTVLMAWNFDLETGAFFVPEQLAGDGEAFSKAVSEEIVRQIGETAAEYDLTAAEMFWGE